MSRIGAFEDDDVAGWIALSPELGKAMAAFSSAVYNRNRLPMRVREIARIVMAYDNECVVCQNTRDADGPAAGVDEDLYAHALQWRTWPDTASRNVSPQSSRTGSPPSTPSCVRTTRSGNAAASSSPTNSSPI